MLWVSRRHHCHTKKKVQQASWRKPDTETGNCQTMVKADFEIWFGHMENCWRPCLQFCLFCWRRFQTKRSHQVQTRIGVKGARVTSWSKQKRFGLVMVVCKRLAQLCSVEHLLHVVREFLCAFWATLRWWRLPGWGRHFRGGVWPEAPFTFCDDWNAAVACVSSTELGKDFDECPPRSPKGAGKFILGFV